MYKICKQQGLTINNHGFPMALVVKKKTKQKNKQTKPIRHAGDRRDAGLIPGQEDPLAEGIPTHSSILAWRIPCTEEPGGQQSIGLQRVGHD